jgi:hypothetical protein
MQGIKKYPTACYTRNPEKCRLFSSTVKLIAVYVATNAKYFVR